MQAEQAVFYLLAGMVIGSALLAVTGKNMVRAIFLFFVSLFAIAGLYILALADFVAITQVVVYAGGVLVLMIFAFMLSDKELLKGTTRIFAKDVFTINRVLALLVVCGFAAVLFFISRAIAEPGTPPLRASDDTVPLLGSVLMTTYLVPFEVVSIFLLVALVGAVHLSRKEETQ